jgi:hypothetical protein
MSNGLPEYTGNFNIEGINQYFNREVFDKGDNFFTKLKSFIFL